MAGPWASTAAAPLEMPTADQPGLWAPRSVAVPCAARPSTGFVHLDGPCHCFIGGPPPEFSPSTAMTSDLTDLLRRTAC